MSAGQCSSCRNSRSTGTPGKGRRRASSTRPARRSPFHYTKQFVRSLRDAGVRVETGEFGAMMDVELVDDGPVTLWLERE